MYRNETSSKNILGSSWGPLHTSLVIWRGKIISKFSFYSFLSAFKNKHVFAITFQDSLRPVLKNGKKLHRKFLFCISKLLDHWTDTVCLGTSQWYFLQFYNFFGLLLMQRQWEVSSKPFSSAASPLSADGTPRRGRFGLFGFSWPLIQGIF